VKQETWAGSENRKGAKRGGQDNGPMARGYPPLGQARMNSAHLKTASDSAGDRGRGKATKFAKTGSGISKREPTERAAKRNGKDQTKKSFP